MARSTQSSRIPQIIERHEESILSEWMRQQAASSRSRTGVLSDAQRRDDSTRFLRLLSSTLARSGLSNAEGAEWEEMRVMLADLSRTRAQQGFSPMETASFVLSLKRPIFDRLRAEKTDDAQALAEEVWAVTELLDWLGLYTAEAFQKGREELIQRQQQEMLELSTPVTRLWDGVLAIPLIGTLDSARTQIVMESLLQDIVATGAAIAIIDITGVPTVDTLVAQHLLKTVAAARLMGAECIISGIRPQIAQTIVHLGVHLGDVVTKASLAEAFKVALSRRGLTVTPLPVRG
jgi:rsbT co-antagonist protein RsbR